MASQTPPGNPISSLAAARRLEVERDLYRELVRLAGAEDPRPFLEEALRLIAHASGSRQGYLALYDEPGPDGEPRAWMAHDLTGEDVRQARAVLSRGIVREAISSGKTLETACAVQDPRFRDLQSVKARAIQQVLCVPVARGGRDACIGVLYLQGRLEPGPFPEADRRLVEEAVAHIAPSCERLLAAAAPGEDPTGPYRRHLRGVDRLAGRSARTAEMLRQVAQVAPMDVTVLLLGPSGSGKTALARAIHENSGRSGGPFLEVNCAALPDTLLEGELFGAEKGAHSTATERVVGKVEAAAGGTLFLDEIGELSLASQARLLQFLQSKRFYRLGDSTPREADVRIVAATNLDLEAAIVDRRFRQDLYYRLAVVSYRVPSLAERREDVVEIAEGLVRELVARHGLPPLTLSAAARAALEVAEWPGNIRQLSNLLEGASIRAALGEGAAQLRPDHLFPGGSPAEASTFHGATRAFQKRLVAEALAATGWNIAEAARRLEIARPYLHELVRAFELTRPG